MEGLSWFTQNLRAKKEEANSVLCYAIIAQRWKKQIGESSVNVLKENCVKTRSREFRHVGMQLLSAKAAFIYFRHVVMQLLVSRGCIKQNPQEFCPVNKVLCKAQSRGNGSLIQIQWIINW